MTKNNTRRCFFVGVLAQMFQLLTNVSFLHKSFKLALLPAKKAMVVVLYVSHIFYFFSVITIYSVVIVLFLSPVLFVGEFFEGIDLLPNNLS